MKIRRNGYDIAANILCLLLLIGIPIYLFINWSNIPDRIPGHYNAMGEVDRMGSKNELLLLPIVNILMYAGFSVVECFPQIWNTGVRVTEANKERVYRTIKSLISTLKLIIVAVFSFLSINSSLSLPLSVWYLPVFLILIFGSILFFILRLLRVSKATFN